MKSFLAFIGFIFVMLLILIVIIESLVIFYSYRDRVATKGDKIGLVRLNGVIVNSEDIINILKRFEKRGDIKGIVIRIESPGGSVAAVQEIYEAVLGQGKGGKKIVASLGNVAASGGYYVALACDRIYANPGTLTGSIGVIMNIVNFQELMLKWGIELNSIASGQYKTTGSPARKMTPEEEELLRNLVTNVHGQFVQAVRDRRSIPEDKLNNLTDGRVMTGTQAYEAGLIDGLGSLEAAIKEAARLCNIKAKPKVIEFKDKRFESFFGIPSEILNNSLQKIRNSKEITLGYTLN